MGRGRKKKANEKPIIVFQQLFFLLKHEEDFFRKHTQKTLQKSDMKKLLCNVVTFFCLLHFLTSSACAKKITLQFR